MSRIGKQPVVMPKGVEVVWQAPVVSVKGPKGTLSLTLSKNVDLQVDANAGVVTVSVQNPESSTEAPVWGTTRALLANLVEGVTKGFTRSLEVNGVGYRANVKGRTLVLTVGFSHDVEYAIPEGVTAQVEKNVITLTGIDKQLVGETAARIRKIKKPEPYGGKGIKYTDEVIRRKAGKAAKTAE